MFFRISLTWVFGSRLVPPGLVVLWIMERTEPPVHQALVSLGPDSRAQGSLPSAPLPGDFSGGQNQFSHGLKVRNSDSANPHSNAGETCPNGLCYCSVTKTCLVLCRPHGLQHTRLPCPSVSPGVCANSCPLSQWCHPTISSSVTPFSSCLQSFPVSGFFQMSQSFTSDGQSTGASASASVLPMNIQDWSPLGWTGWISLLSKGLSRVFSNTTVQKHQFFGTQLCLWVQLSHPYMTTGKTVSLTIRTFFGPVMPLLLNTLPRFVLTFLPKSKHAQTIEGVRGDV